MCTRWSRGLAPDPAGELTLFPMPLSRMRRAIPPAQVHFTLAAFGYYTTPRISSPTVKTVAPPLDMYPKWPYWNGYISAPDVRSTCGLKFRNQGRKPKTMIVEKCLVGRGIVPITRARKTENLVMFWKAALRRRRHSCHFSVFFRHLEQWNSCLPFSPTAKMYRSDSK